MKTRLFVALAPLLVLAACSGGASAEDTITGTTAEVLEQLIERAGEAEESPPAAVAPVASADAQQMLGLSSAEFDELVAEATAAQPLIGTFAHEVAVVKVKETAVAADVAAKMAAGFDSAKWVCVVPDKSVILVSGSYILLAASQASTVDAFVAAFQGLAQDNAGTLDTFYTKA
ncbi:MAG: hypothetical protein LBS56_00845 [Propionibacteriaceae bacterium]|jgi:hypothetical protein|nr:hypothetical protein [Propionibacteriaceae bacterium]